METLIRLFFRVMHSSGTACLQNEKRVHLSGECGEDGDNQISRGVQSVFSGFTPFVAIIFNYSFTMIFSVFLTCCKLPWAGGLSSPFW